MSAGTTLYRVEPVEGPCDVLGPGTYATLPDVDGFVDGGIRFTLAMPMRLRWLAAAFQTKLEPESCLSKYQQLRSCQS